MSGAGASDYMDRIKAALETIPAEHLDMLKDLASEPGESLARTVLLTEWFAKKSPEGMALIAEVYESDDTREKMAMVMAQFDGTDPDAPVN